MAEKPTEATSPKPTVGHIVVWLHHAFLVLVAFALMPALDATVVGWAQSPHDAGAPQSIAAAVALGVGLLLGTTRAKNILRAPMGSFYAECLGLSVLYVVIALLLKRMATSLSFGWALWSYGGLVVGGLGLGLLVGMIAVLVTMPIAFLALWLGKRAGSRADANFERLAGRVYGSLAKGAAQAIGLAMGLGLILTRTLNWGMLWHRAVILIAMAICMGLSSWLLSSRSPKDAASS